MNSSISSRCDPHSPPLRSERREISRLGAASAAVLAILLLWIAPAPVRAESDLPFTEKFARRVEDTFFYEGRLSPSKLSDYRADLVQRRDEALSVAVADRIARGQKPSKATKKAGKKKIVEIYDLLLLEEGQPSGFLVQLARETDPVRSRLLAGRILEIDYALKVEGERLFSLTLLDYLTWMSIKTWTVPSGTEARDADREATNLYDSKTGRFYDAADLRTLIQAGADLSALGPPPDSSTWRDPGEISSVEMSEEFYGGGDSMHEGIMSRFPSSEAELEGIRTTQTKPKFEIYVRHGKKNKQEYKLKVGGEIHSEPTIGALMSALGFNVDVTHYVEDLRVNLGDSSVEEIRNEWRTYFSDHRTHLSYRFDDYFTEGRDERGAYLIAREGVLETRPKELVRLGPWPFGDNGNEGKREVRGLAILTVWVGNTDVKEAENNKLVLRELPGGERRLYHVQHDVGHALGRIIDEQVDAFPWDLVDRSLTGKIKLNYHSVQPTSLRNHSTYADARWMVRLIAQLTRKQIEEAVVLGGWPEPVGILLTEKLIYRRNQLVEAFALEGESTPSGPIRLIPADRRLTTADGAVVDGELVKSAFAGSTQEFANYWEELLGPVWEAVVLTATGLIQGSVGSVAEVVFDKASIGLAAGVVIEMPVGLRRIVVENPNPTSSHDHFLTQDVWLLGIRIGAGVIGRGELTYWRKYTLVQPAGTKKEARHAGGRITDFLLPYNVHTGRVPEEFALIRESYVDMRLRVTTDDASGGSSPVGVDATSARAWLSRDVLSRKHGEYRILEDHSIEDSTASTAFLKLVFVRIPVIKGEASHGHLVGKFYVVPATEVDRNPAMADALVALVNSGEFRNIEQHVRPVRLESQFSDLRRWAGFLMFFGYAGKARYDDVIVHYPAPDFATEHFAQYTVESGGFWSFFDNGEQYRFRIGAVAPIDLDTEEIETQAIVANYVIHDLNTHSDELGDGYVRFVNALATGGEEDPEHRLIAFSPEEHSVNQLWGDLEARVQVGFGRTAIERLSAIGPDTWWPAIAKTLRLRPSELDRYLRRLDVKGKRRQGSRLSVPARIRIPLLRSQRLVAALERAREGGDPSDAMMGVIDVLRHASYRRGAGYDPRILGTLIGLIGAEHVSIRAQIAPPGFRENRLVGKVDLVAQNGVKAVKPYRPELIFDPWGPAQVYEMLDDFPEASKGSPPVSRP